MLKDDVAVICHSWSLRVSPICSSCPSLRAVGLRMRSEVDCFGVVSFSPWPLASQFHSRVKRTEKHPVVGVVSAGHVPCFPVNGDDLVVEMLPITGIGSCQGSFRSRLCCMGEALCSPARCTAIKALLKRIVDWRNIEL